MRLRGRLRRCHEYVSGSFTATRTALLLATSLFRASPTCCEIAWRTDSLPAFLADIAERLATSPALYEPLVACLRTGVLGCESGADSCQVTRTEPCHPVFLQHVRDAHSCRRSLPAGYFSVCAQRLPAITQPPGNAMFDTPAGAGHPRICYRAGKQQSC